MTSTCMAADQAAVVRSGVAERNQRVESRGGRWDSSRESRETEREPRRCLKCERV